MIRSTLAAATLSLILMLGVGPQTPGVKLPASGKTTLPAAEEPVGEVPIMRELELASFAALHRNSRVMERNGRVVRVYGAAFAHGPSAGASASAFINTHARMLGAQPADLKPIGPFPDQRHVQPIMFDAATNTYKFTGLYYTQVRESVPVFRSRLTLLTRNEPGAPLVLASSDLRDLGNFSPSAAAVNANAENLGHQAARHAHAELQQFGPSRRVIFAGVDDVSVPPVLANEFWGSGIDPATGMPTRWLFVTSAVSGVVLHEENLILDVDVTGNVSGQATTGNAADSCAQSPESLAPLPYARVAIGATTAFADVNGNFTIPNAGTGSVSVNSTIRGPYFRVFNQGGASASLTQNVTPPGPVNFVHNAANTSEQNRAEVNAYIHANVARDFALAQNPVYPQLPGQSEFPVNVNINLNCNAFYDPIDVTINFYVSGGGCTNTANATVVHHEFGHHLIQVAGSGQGAYGEGMSDCIAVCITDSSCLGQGFMSCASCLRDANNNLQYPYNASIHEAGRLISGCIWSTRNALLATNPLTYRQILSALTVNSILLHTGTGIDPSITVDFLTLDDDNSDILDGTPHYNEIAAGFGSHNMDAPTLAPIKFNYPSGRPDLVNPSGGPVIQVQVQPLSGTPVAGSAQMHLNTGSGFFTVPMTEITPNNYEAAFPATSCGGIISYYFSAQAVGGQTINSPSSAPTRPFTAISATSAGPVVFADNFQSDLGWTVVNNGATDGQWNRGVPAGDGTRGDPTVDADNSGSCYLTDNVAGNSDVDGGTTRLVSPTMDATVGQPIVHYWRWYSNHTGADPHNDTFVVEVSSNNGTTWTALETVGPAGSEVDGGWFEKSFALAQVPGFAITNQFKIRFSASDLGSGSVVEAAVDGVELRTYNCSAAVPGDVTGDGNVDIDDLTAVILAWGTCSGCPADLNDDGDVDIDDLTEVILNWN